MFSTRVAAPRCAVRPASVPRSVKAAGVPSDGSDAMKGVERKAKQAKARIDAANSDKTTEETGLQDALPDVRQALNIDPLLNDEDAKAAENKDNSTILDKAKDALNPNK